ncbi:hypothetical protein CHS0354_025477 [Potamilus streckersoni]|uniref:Uncharacterized protein n=1 Tax=Potamilus streckersoni TaxID=2493646 RepID=A0AAE0VHE7_9BIVA|nr:hypothetical protein CHS0354_025477 [Potamilus streckersoni]
MSAQSLNQQDFIGTDQVNVKDGDLNLERLKDLTEEALLIKVQKLVAYLKQMEEYHSGDGEKVQDILGHMYWDYRPLRETIGDTMDKEGYAGMLVLVFFAKEVYIVHVIMTATDLQFNSSNSLPMAIV